MLAIQVHGCFWHQHPGCRHAKLPRSRPEYWLPKLARNIERDQQTQRALHAMGWRTAIIWECNASDPARLRRRLKKLL
jgi:DNA mismatch endonuclease (patch repair protein)